MMVMARIQLDRGWEEAKLAHQMVAVQRNKLNSRPGFSASLATVNNPLAGRVVQNNDKTTQLLLLLFLNRS
jgi:hypothetical protein